MNSNSGDFHARTHGAEYRSPIPLARIIIGVQQSFIAPGTHPRPTLLTTTLPPPPRARTTHSNAFPPCLEMLRPMCPLPTVFNGRHHPRDQHGSSLLQLPPDRSHDHLQNSSRAHTRSPTITRAPRTGSCTAIRARRTHTQRTHAEQHMTPARTAHALGARAHTRARCPCAHVRARPTLLVLGRQLISELGPQSPVPVHTWVV